MQICRGEEEKSKFKPFVIYIVIEEQMELNELIALTNTGTLLHTPLLNSKNIKNINTFLKGQI